MKRIFFAAATLIVSSFFIISCGDQGAENAANKPANAANASNTATAPAANNAAVEADIKKLMDTAQAALSKNDADAMDKIYNDNYMLVNIDGSVQTKAERLASLRSGDAKYESFSYDEVNIRVRPDGTGAIVIARATIKGTNKGKPVNGTFRVTQVYGKTNDGWKQVTAQATPITAAEPAKTEDKKAEANKPAAPANK